MSCFECFRLVAERERLGDAYIVAFDAMIAGIAIPKSGFSKLRIAADEARTDSAIAKLEFEHHKDGHTHAHGILPRAV